ncbi:MAG: hypothetical protein M3336_15995, partial [Chloroflexota bacterium]|nr:hypothetical protein [Chloroflexota bacterium]
MVLTPGGRRSPSAPPPPKPTPPPRGTRDSRAGPRIPQNAALAILLRWVLLIGGLIIIVDLGTHALQQRSSTEVLPELTSANLAANVVLFLTLGAIVARQTGLFYLGVVGGLLAALLDGVVVASAASLAPPPGGAAPLDAYL